VGARTHPRWSACAPDQEEQRGGAADQTLHGSISR
jgi:hypothetical protein